MTGLRQASSLAFAAALCSAAMAAAQPASGPDAARLYDEGDFAGALAIWRELADNPGSGLDPAPLHYNMGNAEFRSGRLGQAMLQWERALLHRPGDEDALANLELARGILDQRLADEASSGESNAFALELLGSMEGFVADLRRVPPVRLAIALGATALLAGGCLTLALLGRGRRRLVVAALAVSLAATAAVLTILRIRVAAPPVAVVVEAGAALRSGPGPTFPQLAALPEGFYLELDESGVEEARGFRRVIAAGIVGYADSASVVPVVEAP